VDALERLLPSQHQAHPEHVALRKLYEGVIHKGATAVTSLVTFTVAEFDGGMTEHGPAPWMPRPERLPQPGDRCLVCFVPPGATPWIVCWTPYGRT